MKVTSEPTEDCQVILTIEVEPERVERSIDHAYRRLANRVNIPGFRKGKAPRPIVERYLGGRTVLLEEALERLVPEVYEEAIKDQEIEPVAQPQFEVTQLEPVTFKATVPLPPKVELGDYRSIRKSLPAVEVTEQDIDEVLRAAQEREAIWEPVERPVELGDRVIIDLEGTRDGEPLPSNQGIEYDVLAESQAPVPGFAEQIVGMAKDEAKSLDFSFPEDDERELFAGHTYHFTVTVHDIKGKILPELDDDFAKTVAQDVETLDELKERIRENLRLDKEYRNREQLESDVIDEAVSGSTIVVPPALVEREIDLILQQQEQMLADQRISLEQYLRYIGQEPQAYREELRESADRRLKQKLVLEHVAEAENLTASPEEIDQELEQLTNQGQQEPTPAAVRDAVQRILQRRKAVEWLVSHSTEGAAGSVDAPAEASPDDLSEAEPIEQPESDESPVAATSEAVDEAAQPAPKSKKGKSEKS